MNLPYYNKYIKYKTKYIELKKNKQIGGNNVVRDDAIISSESIKAIILDAIKELEKRGKNLDSTDLQKINQQVDDIIRSENELKELKKPKRFGNIVDETQYNIMIIEKELDLMKAKKELLKTIKYIQSFNKFLDDAQDYTIGNFNLDTIIRLMDRLQELQQRHTGYTLPSVIA